MKIPFSGTGPFDFTLKKGNRKVPESDRVKIIPYDDYVIVQIKGSSQNQLTCTIAALEGIPGFPDFKSAFCQLWKKSAKREPFCPALSAHTAERHIPQSFSSDKKHDPPVQPYGTIFCCRRGPRRHRAVPARGGERQWRRQLRLWRQSQRFVSTLQSWGCLKISFGCDLSLVFSMEQSNVSKGRSTFLTPCIEADFHE